MIMFVPKRIPLRRVSNLEAQRPTLACRRRKASADRRCRVGRGSRNLFPFGRSAADPREIRHTVRESRRTPQAPLATLSGPSGSVQWSTRSPRRASELTPEKVWKELFGASSRALLTRIARRLPARHPTAESHRIVAHRTP